MTSSSESLFDRATKVIPGGVNSPVRAFGAVGGKPLYVATGAGARITTVEGRELTDYCGSWGPLILGHAREEVVEAVRRAAGQGASFGINTPREVEFAERLCERVPSMDSVRLVSSGTEAVMTAIRLARGFRGRSKIVKFEGCYHGHSDSLLVSAGSGLLTGGLSSSAGVADALAALTFVAPFNDTGPVQDIVDRHGDDLAAIIVEPVAGNMGLVPPASGFLEGLREQADRCGALLIFDEVISGFRLGPTTYGHLCGVTPDLTCLGKIIGGGLPIGAVGGRAEVMDRLAPLGPVYQAGTLSGNPVAVAAGLATLEVLMREDPYPRLDRMGTRLAEGIAAAACSDGVDAHCARLGGMFTVFFRSEPVRDLADARNCDATTFGAFFRSMLDRGIYLPPSQFETAFVSAAHTEDDIERFVEAATDTFSDLAHSLSPASGESQPAPPEGGLAGAGGRGRRPDGSGI